MTLRRVLRALAAGTVLVGPGLAAPAAASAAPTHVAIVVGGVGSACIPWHSGMTGFDVLAGAGFTVTYGQQPPYIGFVFTIGGLGTSRPDNTHYWAYFHDAGGGWQYSSTGGASYRPQPGTVEGWNYVDGQTTAPAPPARSYADICAGKDPTPSHSTTPTPKRTTAAASAARSTASSPAPATLPAAAVPVTARPTVTARPATRLTSRPSSAGAPTTRRASGPTTPPTAATTPEAQRRSTGGGSSAIPTAGTALGLLAVVGLGAAAYRRARRNGHGRSP